MTGHTNFDPQFSCHWQKNSIHLIRRPVLQKNYTPLDCKEIQPVHPKGDQSWVFIGRTDVESETPHGKS